MAIIHLFRPKLCLGFAALLVLQALPANAQSPAVSVEQSFEQKETLDLVALVDDAAGVLQSIGEKAFDDFAVTPSRWRQGESYIFVLDLDGNMLVHPDPQMRGKNELELKDINGKPIIRGLLDAATRLPGKPEGWYHYQWAVPGGILPRWKSSYVRLVSTPSGKKYVIGSGSYTDRMERAFVVDAVRDAVGLIEKEGPAAFERFRDLTGPFLAKDTYIFVYDMDGVNLVLPPFANLEGRNLLDMKDTHGKLLIREMLDVVQKTGSGWVDYMWPKPGENVPTEKSAYVSRATIGAKPVMVGAGVYLADAPKATATTAKLSAPDLMTLVREAAAVLEARGEEAYPDFAEEGSKWFHGETYLFVWTMEGTRVFHAADPEGEGADVRDMKDTSGRPMGRMMLDAAASLSGEGWIHYMRPEPGSYFPTWKSTFVKRVTFPSGRQHLVGCGIYNMQMSKPFIEDVVDRAAALVASQGKDAFAQLRDRHGSFVFMDTYVFVDTPDGTELVNPVQPGLEGKNLRGLKDLKGLALADEYIEAALERGSAWVEYWWYRPGTNAPARKQAYVRKVQHGKDVYIVGSGLYLDY